MWASELIKILQAGIVQCGDMPVVVECTRWDGGERYRAFPEATVATGDRAPLREDGTDGGFMVVIKEKQ